MGVGFSRVSGSHQFGVNSVHRVNVDSDTMSVLSLGPLHIRLRAYGSVKFFQEKLKHSRTLAACRPLKQPLMMGRLDSAGSQRFTRVEQVLFTRLMQIYI